MNRKDLALMFAVGIAILVFTTLWATLPESEKASAQTALDIANVYGQFIDAINRGDAAKATAVFADDAQLIGFPPSCLTSPCVGTAAIRAQMDIDVAIHLRLTATNVQVSGSTLTANVEHQADPIRAAGLARVLVGDNVTFRGDKIVKLVASPDTTDAPTKAFVAILLAPPPAQPQVQTPSVAARPISIQPPATGDAGLASGSGRSTLLTISAVSLLALAPAGIMTRAFVRRRT